MTKIVGEVDELREWKKNEKMHWLKLFVGNLLVDLAKKAATM